MRICTKCRIEKPVAEFAFRDKKSGRLQAWCRACWVVYHRDYYSTHHQKQIADVREDRGRRIRKLREHLRSYLATHPCVDCGENDIVVLEFDHLSDKQYNVSQLIATARSLPLILEEIQKCVVRCANCHRRKTAIERGYYEEKRAYQAAVTSGSQLEIISPTGR